MWVLSLWLAAVLTAVRAFSVSASTQHACAEVSGSMALIEQGSNQRLSPAARQDAYERAIRLCREATAAYDGLGVLLLKRGQYHGALHWIHQGLSVAPGDPTLRRDLGVALLSIGKPEAGLEVLQALAPSAQGEFYLGMAYLALRQHHAARQAFARSFAMGDSDPYVLYQVIEEDRALHDEKQGLRDFKIFCERFPDSAWLHLLLGNAYSSRNNRLGAESEYRQAAQLDPKLPLAHFDLGRLAFNRANYAEALHDFEDEIAVDPTFGEAYLYAGTTLRRLGKNQPAIPYLEDAVAHDPNFPLAYRELAVAQIQAQQLQAALRTLREGEQRFPTEPAFPAQSARLLRQLGEIQQAGEQSERAEALSGKSNVQLGDARSGSISRSGASSTNVTSIQQLDLCLHHEDAQCASRILHANDEAQWASNPDYLNLKAEALNLLHQERPALSAAQHAIKLDPDRADFFVTEGRIQQRLGDQSAAVRSFLYAEQLQPGAEAPVYYAGMSFFMLGYDNNDNGYYDRAARHFKTALELNPRDDRARFMLGVIDSIEFKLVDAQKNLAEALKMNPRNPYYHLHYGLLLGRTGHLAEAQRELELAETLNPSYAATYLRLGDLDAQIRKYNNARAQLETAVRLDPRLSSAYYTLGQVYSRLGMTVKSRAALKRFQQTKSLEQKENDPIGASINAVVSRAQTDRH